MTDLLKKALAEVEETFSDEEQDRLGRWLLDFAADERKWDALFADPRSEGLLERMADAALAAKRAGRTRKLDPDSM